MAMQPKKNLDLPWSEKILPLNRLLSPKKKGGGQLMGKNVLKSALVDIVVGVVIGHILALSTGYGDMPPTHHEAQPKLMYVERQAPASDGGLAMVARRW